VNFRAQIFFVLAFGTLALYLPKQVRADSGLGMQVGKDWGFAARRPVNFTLVPPSAHAFDSELLRYAAC